MHKLRRVVSNTVISLLGQGVTWISTLLLTMAYGRFLGDVKFGELYFATTFVLLMGIPIQSGYDQQTTRGVAQEPDQALRYSSNIFLIKVGIWLVIYSLTLLLAWLLGYSPEVRTLIGISGLTLLSSAIGTTFASLHYALEQVIFPVVGSILEKVLSAFLGILLLRNGASVQVMALVLLGGSIAGGIWQAIWFYQKVGTGFVVDRRLIRELIRTNIPFLIYGVLSVIYYRID
ncbi:MAG TPA: oligosaccharide flippase family protein, partial [Ktedonobacteraceae bacterium]|nr:oligosaccharide flippase family protein [Ktedonobacteraceae bacterium]